jgi:hypothetical protein
MPTLIGPGDLIVGAWTNFRKNIKLYAELLAWFALLSVIYWAIFTFCRAFIPDRVLRSVAVSVLSLPVVFAYVIVMIALIDVTAKALAKKKIDLRASLSLGVHKLIPFLWVSILLTAVMIGGFLLFIIPALIFYVWYKFALFAVIVDDHKGSRALAASHDLVTDRWWATLWRVAIPRLFFWVAASFTLAVTYLLAGSLLGDPGLFFGDLRDVGELSNAENLITTVVPQIINGLTLPLFVGADLLLWLDLKKTATDPLLPPNA